MKYGETLRQRSVPQWAYHNVQYDSLKWLIKENTTPGKAKAVSIPGQGERVETTFENAIYNHFADEHTKIGLFVKSKSGEIDRRLESLSRQLHAIQIASWPPSVAPTRIPASRLAKFGRIEEQAIQTGEEIKHLSRFIAAQRTAFIKLLKKYKKWTGRTALEHRFKVEVLNRPDTFTMVRLDSQLEDWASLLQEIRFAMGVGLAPSGTTTLTASPAIQPMVPTQSSISVARKINKVLSHGSDVEFDSAMASIPLGSEGSRAVYWVHPEQLVEVQVLLLQHTRLAFAKSAPGSRTSLSGSTGTTRRNSLSLSRRDSTSGKVRPNGVLVLDNADDLARQQNSIPISDTEDSFSTHAETTMLMRWSEDGEMAICLPHGSSKDSNTHEYSTSLPKLKQKHLNSFLDLNKEFHAKSQPSAESLDLKALVDRRTPLATAREWLVDHPSVKPLVGIVSKRTRFMNLPSDQDCGQWCILDADIAMGKISIANLGEKDWSQRIALESTEFPYAVLKVRQEGRNKLDLIKILDESHLTERVRGFSLTTQALWACRRPPTMTPPFWLPVLSGDIRKLPSAFPIRQSRRSQAKPTPRAGSTSDENVMASSSTAVSTTAENSSGTASTDKRFPRGRSVRYAPTVDTDRRQEQKQIRYWSEYDHPEDGSDDENGYYIYVDPDADDSWFPFKDTAQSIFKSIKNLVKRPKLRTSADEENSPLLSRRRSNRSNFLDSPITDNESISSSDDDDNELLRPRTKYGTLPVSQPLASGRYAEYDAIGITLASSISLFSSFTLSTVLMVLTAVGKKHDKGEIDLVLVAGLFISFLMAIGGLLGTFHSQTKPIHRVATIVVFGAVILMNGILTGHLINDLTSVSDVVDDPSILPPL